MRTQCGHGLGRGKKPIRGHGSLYRGVLKKAGHETTLVTLNDKGAEPLTDEIIDSTDVMFWWGHWYHLAVADEVISKVADRALRGMGMVFYTLPTILKCSKSYWERPVL